MPAPLPSPPPSQRRATGPKRRLLLAAGLLPLAALARVPAPRGKVLLSITGRISRPNVGDRADFDLAALDALPQHAFSTAAPWYEGRRQFSGPLLRDVLEAVGASGSLLRAAALNDYQVDIPVEDSRRYKVLLATRQEGKTMAVRDKGPLFVIYPFDEGVELRSERYYSRSAWQLRRLHVS